MWTDGQAALVDLADAILRMMDKSSSGGALLACVGGIGGLMDTAKSFKSSNFSHPHSRVAHPTSRIILHLSRRSILLHGSNTAFHP